jgi:hypothetical protein
MLVGRAFKWQLLAEAARAVDQALVNITKEQDF